MSACPIIRIGDRVRFLTRAMGLVFLLGWMTWFWPFDDLLDRQGTPLGADFSMFYVAGQVAADGAFDRLYDQAEHQQRLHGLFPGLSPQFSLPFRYPPIVALLMAPLSRLPYPVAWLVFAGLSCGALAIAIWLLKKMSGMALATGGMAMSAVPPGASALPLTKPTLDWQTAAIWACLGWPVALEVLIGGQASLFGLAIAAGTCALLKAHRPIAAGAILALAAYKPNLLALFAVGVAIRDPRVVLGAIPVFVAFLGLNCLAGLDTFAEFINLTTHLASRTWDVETPFWKVHSLANWFEFAAPGKGRIVCLFVGFAAAIAIGSVWRLIGRLAPRERIGLMKFQHSLTLSERDGDDYGGLWLALLLAVNAVFNPYTPIYDLVLLAGAGWLVAERFLCGPEGGSAISPIAAQGLVAVLFFGPHLSQSLARPLGVQVFPILLIAVSIVIVWKSPLVRAQRASNRSRHRSA